MVQGSFIVLKTTKGEIRFTLLERLLSLRGSRMISHYKASHRKQLSNICCFLNDLWDRHPESSPGELLVLITAKELQYHFDRYVKKDLQESTISRYIHTITDFAYCLALRYPNVMQYEPEDLYKEQTVSIKRNHKWETVTKMVPRFEVKTPGKASEPFRDLPVKVFCLLLQQAMLYQPDIAFAIALQAFAGLRAGECLSVRQENSGLGPGIRFIHRGSQTQKISIDVSQNYSLRQDGIFTGHIKKLREAEVFPAFIPAVVDLYHFHLHYLNGRTYDRERCPMFIDQRGNALTYGSYLKRFRKLVEDHLRPTLMNSSDPDLHTFGILLQMHTLTPHSLRHAYSVMLVNLGCDASMLQYYRGDKNPASSEPYLRGKSDLNSKYIESQNTFVSGIIQSIKEVIEIKRNEHNS